MSDEFEEEHSLKDVLTHMDELEDDLILDKPTLALSNNGTHAILNVSQPNGFNIHVNVDRIEYDFGTNATGVVLTSGTNASPQLNIVTIQISGGSPVLMSEATYPSAEHVDIARLLIGDKGYVISYEPNTYKIYGSIPTL